MVDRTLITELSTLSCKSYTWLGDTKSVKVWLGDNKVYGNVRYLVSARKHYLCQHTKRGAELVA